MKGQVNKMKKRELYDCPVEITLDVIGGKWKSVILYHLIDGTKRFGELKRLYPKISQRILTLQLRELESDQIIKRTVYPEVPPKVEYSLTEFGKTLSPLVKDLKAWGQKYNDKVIKIKKAQEEERK